MDGSKPPVPAEAGSGGLGVVVTVAAAAVFAAALISVHRSLRRRGAGGAGIPLGLALLTVPALAGCTLLLLLGRSLETEGGRVLLSILVLSSVHAVLALVDQVLFGRRGPDVPPRFLVPKIFRDGVRWTLFFVVILVVLGRVWDLHFRELSILAGALSIALSLALGPTLGSLISGITLTSERPFDIGDWIDVDGRQGRVEQITWRSTRIVTIDDERIIYPNATLASTRIVNLSRPERRVGTRCRVGVHYRTPPLAAEDALRRAVRGVPGVLDAPAPTFRIVDFADSAVTWEVRFFVQDPERLGEARAEVMRRTWYSLRRAGIEIPYPIRNLVSRDAAWDEGRAGESGERARVLRNTDLLRAVPVFAALPEDSIQRLAAAVRDEDYLDGESITVEGETGDRMYVIVRGRVRALVTLGGRAEEVATLEAGNYFGEMSLLTGAPRTATVLAAGSVELISLASGDLAAELREHPEFARRIADAAAVRRTVLDERSSKLREAREARQVPTSSPSILGGIIRFFGLQRDRIPEDGEAPR